MTERPGPVAKDPDSSHPRSEPAPGRARQRDHLSLGAAIVWFAVAYGGAMLGYLAVNAFAARLLGDRFGYFVTAVTISTVLGQLGLMGVHRGGLREAARLRPDDVEGLRELRGGVRAVSWLTLPATAVATAAVTFALLGDTETGSRWAIAVATGALVWLSGQQKLCASYLRGFGQIRLASLLEGRSGGVLVAAAQGILLGAVLVFFSGWGLAGALGALALGFAIPLVVAWPRVTRPWRHLDGSHALLRELRTATRRNWRFASNLLGGYLNSVVEIWIAALVLTAAGASLFSAAQRLSVLLVVPLVSLGVVFSPVVSRLFGSDDRRLEALLRTGATLAAAVTAVVWLPMLLLPEPLLVAVYGPEFAPAAPALVLLTIGGLANVLSGLSGTALMMSRHEDVVWVVQWAAVAVRVPAGVVTAMLFGPEWLALSAAVVTAGLYFTLWLLALRRAGLRTHLTLRPRLRLLRETSG